MTSTTVLVRVIAAGGKFLGDDIGGAAVTVRDVLTREVLAQGVTSGGSGPKELMCTSFTRLQKIPDDGASGFTASLMLSSARQIEITAYGPLAARGSANTASVTTWVYPGHNIPFSSATGNGIVLELPGLVCQIMQPTTHDTNFTEWADVDIVANVAMMCGCPISPKDKEPICKDVDPNKQPWLPADFIVFAILPGFAGSPIQLLWDDKKAVPGRFIGTASQVPKGTYPMTVFAQQKSTGNTGADLSTFVVNLKLLS